MAIVFKPGIYIANQSTLIFCMDGFGYKVYIRCRFVE